MIPAAYLLEKVRRMHPPLLPLHRIYDRFLPHTSDCSPSSAPHPIHVASVSSPEDVTANAVFLPLFIPQHTAMGLIWLMASKPWSEYREIKPLMGTAVYKLYYPSTWKILTTFSA